ncbi:hypothetical protein RB614_37590 [Phytohabitans sp. ZYX-F-186]|uniref:RDD domain-containing protein n=1 Tax=Phytohabitans maris TaxID=3071409 RepID=A0ABU0ZW83_9ACTN|nr:hypothetical protein [Phytohabitans sp. ZYX-F-186]MDQ7910222.1 hypothetical protein [Phytohabitans sp. ZYX-F-186]
MTTPYPRHSAAPAAHLPAQAASAQAASAQAASGQAASGQAAPPYGTPALAVPVVAGPGPYPAPAQPPPATYSAATRHLCAGAYLDAEFRRTSLRDVYYQPKRMVAPSYGFDLGTVLLHCLRARNIAFFRDATLLVVMVFALVASPLPFVAAMVLLWTAHFTVEGWRVLRDAMGRIRAGGQLGTTILARLGMLAVRWFVSQFVLLLFALIVIGLTPEEFEGEGMTGSQVAGILLLLLIVYAIPLTANLVVQVQLGTLTPNGSFATAPRGERFDEIAYQQQGNQVVYSGDWPFVGSGDPIDRWSFAQRLMRPARLFAEPATEAQREFDTPPFTAQELVDTVRESLRTFAFEPDPERRLPALTVEDRLFVAGTEISHLVPHTTPDRMAQAIRYPTNPARHYLVCQVVSWNGELVTTVYVHVAVQGRMLYLETVTAALPPCKEEYRIVDQVGGTGPAAYGKAVLDGILDTPRLAASALANLVRTGLEVLGGALSSAGVTVDRAVTRGYDYGARYGVRDLGRAVAERHHLQAQDIDKYAKLVRRRIIATVLDFLDARGVDTAEFVERAVNILNAGAIHTGTGNITIDGPGVGNQTNNYAGPAAPGGGK